MKLFKLFPILVLTLFLLSACTGEGSPEPLQNQEVDMNDTVKVDIPFSDDLQIPEAIPADDLGPVTPPNIGSADDEALQEDAGDAPLSTSEETEE